MPDSKSAPRRILFSKTRLEALPAPNRGRVYYNDTQAAGLCLCVTNQGTKTFYHTKKLNGRTERVRLGRFPEGLTVEQARKLAATLNVAVAGGHDPQEAKRARREEATFGQLWSHWENHSRRRKKAATLKEDNREYDAYLKDWAGRRLSTIKRQDVAALHSRMGNKNGAYQANRVLALVKAMFNKADGLGFKGENPARGIEKFPEVSRDRFLMPEELPAFFKALAGERNPFLQGFFVLALLTGARRGNLTAMRWAEISWELRQWRIPETKAGMPVVVPLSPPAMEVLERLRELAKPDCEWVFPGRHRGHLKDPMPAWRRLLTRAKLQDLRIHDLRRSLGSWQALGGASLHIIGKSLGHTRPETTAIYARLTLDPVRESVERAGAAILAAGKQAENGERESHESRAEPS